jgi:hypothetical protein
MQISTFISLVFIVFDGLIIRSSTVVAEQPLLCHKGGDRATLGGSCNSTAYIFTEQCNLAEVTDLVTNTTTCTVTAQECGCHYTIAGNSTMVAIGSGSIDGCDNACVKISLDVPIHKEACLGDGSTMSFQGTCDSKGYTYTPMCKLEERPGGEGEEDKIECFVSEKRCGCVYWEDGGTLIKGIVAERHCDVCGIHFGSGAFSYNASGQLWMIVAVMMTVGFLLC